MKLRKIIEFDIRSEKQMTYALQSLLPDTEQRRRLKKLGKLHSEDKEGVIISNKLPLVTRTIKYELFEEGEK